MFESFLSLAVSASIHGCGSIEAVLYLYKSSRVALQAKGRKKPSVFIMISKENKSGCVISLEYSLQKTKSSLSLSQKKEITKGLGVAAM